MGNSPQPSQSKTECYPLDLLPNLTQPSESSPPDNLSLRDSQVLPSPHRNPQTPPAAWSSDADIPSSTPQYHMVATAERQAEIIRMVDGDEKVAVGKTFQHMENGEVLEIKEVLRRERHVVIFYCHYPDFPGKEAILIARNEQVDWSMWRRVFWYLSFPFLQSRSSLSDSPV